MPTIVSGPVAVVNDLAADLANQLSKGPQARASVGSKGAAFAWTTGAPPILASKVNRVAVEGLSFQSVSVSLNATPPVKVAEGGTKPVSVDLVAATNALHKYAGIGKFSTEQYIGTDALAQAVYQVLISGALLAYDTDVVNAAETASGVQPVSGASWSAAILNGIAAVASKGGAADLVVLNPADYAAAVEPAGYALDPTTSVPVLFGCQVVISAAKDAGSALVLSSAAVTAAESDAGPVAVVDPYSGLSTNEIRIAGEFFGGYVVNAPACIAVCTKTP